MLHGVWDWRADGLGCVQSVERRCVVLKQSSYAAQVLLTASSLTFSECQLLGFQKGTNVWTGVNVEEQEMIHIDVHQLFNGFFCREKEMIGTGKKSERQKTSFNIFSAQLLIAYYP